MHGCAGRLAPTIDVLHVNFRRLPSRTFLVFLFLLKILQFIGGESLSLDVSLSPLGSNQMRSEAC